MSELGRVSGIGNTKETPIGDVVTIRPGTYEVTTYTNEGPAHSAEEVEVAEQIEGLLVEEIYEGRYFYNVAVKNEQNQTIFLLVPKQGVVEKV